MLHAVTQGNQGFVEGSNKVDFMEYGIITVKMSWLFAKTFESLCDTENCELFGDLKTLTYSV
jgi:hypothetical protein